MSDFPKPDKWPHCPVCGKAYKVVIYPVGFLAADVTGFYRDYTYWRAIPDCECPTNETEGTT